MSKFIDQKAIILASGSTIRSKLMSSLGLEFSVIPSDCDEDAIKNIYNSSNVDVVELGYALAKAKALDVSKRFPDHFVIAADQLCVIGQTILDKPMNHQTAIEHLRLLSGKKHQQIACLCIAKNNNILWQHHEIAELELHQLNDQTIESYLLSEKPYYSCGAYHFESQGKWLFKEVKGNEETILGLPLMPLVHALLDLGAVLVKNKSPD